MSTPKVQLIKDARPEVIEAGDNLAAAIRGLMPFPLVMNAAANGLLAKWEAAKSAPTEVPQEAAGHPIGFPTHPATWPDGLPTTDEAIAKETAEEIVGLFPGEADPGYIEQIILRALTRAKSTPSPSQDTEKMAAIADKWLTQFEETVEGLDPEEKAEVDADRAAIDAARNSPSSHQGEKGL